MPLTMARTGEECTIKKVGGKSETRRFLESLGFVVGAIVTVVSENAGNLIVNIKNQELPLTRQWLIRSWFNGKENL